MRAIARYTAKQFLRKKILYIIVCIAVVLFLGSVIAWQLALSEKAKVIQDLSLSIVELCWIVMTLFFWSSLIADEVSQGTIFLLLSKHTKRWSLIVGKYLGFALILLCVCVVLSLVSTWMMFVYHIPVNSILIYVFAGIYSSWLITLAVVMFFSTFVSPFVTLLVSLVIYVLGHMMSFVVYYVTVLKAHAFPSWFHTLIEAIYFIVPNYTLLNVQEFMGVPYMSVLIPQQFIASSSIALVTIVLLLTLAALIFRKKEL